MCPGSDSFEASPLYRVQNPVVFGLDCSLKQARSERCVGHTLQHYREYCSSLFDLFMDVIFVA